MAKKRKCEYSTRSSVGPGHGLKRPVESDDMATGARPPPVVNNNRERKQPKQQENVGKRRSRSRPRKQPSSISSAENDMTLAGMGLLSQDDGIPANGEEEDVFQPPVIDPRFLTDSPGGIGGIPAALAELELEMGDFYGSPASLAPFSIDGHDLGPEADNKDDDNSLPSSLPSFTSAADQADFLTGSDVSSFSVESIHMTGTPSNKDTTMARSSLLSGSGPKLGSRTTTCPCIITAVSIYEAIQVDLNGGESAAALASEAAANASGPFPSPGSSPSKSSTTTYRGTFASSSQNIHEAPKPLSNQMVLLQRQKTALARFEPLLWCAACWSRSEFVMLMITMCERVLASLDKIVLEQQQQRHSHRGIYPNPEDDELELVISLLKSRMARLGNLLAMTEGAVSANGWPSHGRITQGLRRKFNELLFSLSFCGLH